MSIKKIFNKDDELKTILTSTDIETAGKEVESAEYIKSFTEDKDRFVPHVDFSSASNFAKFGLAEQYYEDAIKRVYKTYPYDGSLKEKLDWNNSSSYFENYIFEKRYPRTTGYITLAANGWGLVEDETKYYTSSSLGEYILFKGGPHVSTRGKGEEVTDTSGDYKSGYSNYLDLSKNRESNLKIDGADGNTVEFWMRKDAFSGSRAREVIFDTYTANAVSGSAGYGRMTIELTGGYPDADSSTFSPLLLTYMSGNVGFASASLGSGSITTNTIADGEWHHYAISVANSGSSNLQAKLYVDGQCNSITMGGQDDYATATIQVIEANNLDVPQIGFAHVVTTIEIITTDNTTITAKADLSTTTVNDTNSPTFKAIFGVTDRNAKSAANLAKCLNANSKLSATANGSLVTVTQATAGSNGNTTITLTDVRTALNKYDFSGGDSNLAQGASTATIDYVSGAMVAAIGALAQSSSFEEGALGWGKLSASLDEFRFWKTNRTAQDIGRYHISQVGGGANTDTANTDLGVYYKFNEGIVSNSNIDSSVLDYSGRISNGVWNGYTSISRNTGSAIVSSSFTSASFEFLDPILYSEHSKVNSFLTSSMLIGKEYDYRNNSSLYHSFPSWIVEEDTGGTLKKLTQIIATYLDTLYLQIQELPKIKNVNYLSGAHKPYPFTNRLLEAKGFIAPDLFPDAEIIEHFLHRGEKELFAEKLYDIKNKIYQNIYNNLSYIYKSKGTEKAFRNLIRCYGVGHELLKLNLYGDNVTYNFEDNFSSLSVKKKAVDFSHPDRYGATVYQFTASSDVNSTSFISGAINSATASVPMTVEAEVIFPKKFSPASSYYTHFPFLTSSLFGMHTAKQTGSNDGSENLTDLTWYDADPGNFQVYAIRKTDSANIISAKGFNRSDAFFMLTSSDTGLDGGLIPELTSSVFSDVYNNSKWNFAVRMRPTNNPFAGNVHSSFTSDTTYHVEFYGVNSEADVIINEFLVTGTITNDQGKQFMTSSKRMYLGAHRTDFVSGVLQYSDVKITSARYWQSYLNDEAIKAHARDPENFGTLHPHRSAYLFEDLALPVEISQIDTLALNWDFSTVSASNAGNADSAGYYAGTTNSASFNVEDFSSGSTTLPSANTWSGAVRLSSSYGWLGNIIKKQHTGKGDFFLPNDTGSISTEYLHSARQNLPENLHSSDLVKVLSNDDESFTRETRPTTHFFAVEKSMYQIISQEMLNMFATIVDFNNLIGEPINTYRQDYKDLAKLRQFFFEKVQKNPDIERFFDYYKWIDGALSEMILQIMPASAEHADKIRNIIESHVLERNKYWAKFPTLDNLGARPTGNNIESAAGAQSSDGASKDLPPASIGMAQVPPGMGDYSPLPNPLPGTQLATNLPKPGTTGPGPLFKYASQQRNKPADSSTGDIRSGDDGVDNARENIRKVIKEGFGRNSRSPANFTVDRKSSIDIASGHNVHKNKKNLGHKLTADFSSRENDITVLSTDIEREGELASAIRNLAQPERKVKLPLVVRQAPPAYGAHIMPFNLHKTTAAGGYIDRVSGTFSSSVGITNIHYDSTNPTNEVSLQGPFTEKFVGGNQHRHIDINFNAQDTSATRAEAWKISLSSNTITLSKPDSAEKPRAQLTRDEYAKRPVNIRNIRQTTGSNVTSIGNFTNDYDIVQTSGRGINNRHFTSNEGISVEWLATQKPDSVALPIYGVPEYATINRSVSGSNKSVFIERFSAPGDPATMCAGMLDIESGEKSIYNALPWRNLSVRMPLNILLTDHTNQFGYYSDTSLSSSYRDAINDGIKAAGSYPGYNGVVNSSNYHGSASFHKIHRNTKRVLKYTDKSSQDVYTSSCHDNWFIQHPIPQSDMQYTWITGAATNSIIGYQQKDHANAGQASTDIAFALQSDIENASGIKVDFVGMNNIVVDPIIRSLNTLSSSTNSYGNTTMGTVGNSSILNALLLNRNGPTQHPSWKQTRGGDHPVVRDQHENNIFSILEETSNNGNFLNLTESAITSRYLPMKHVFIPKGGASPVLFKHTYANNLGTFANKKFVEMLNTYILGGDQIYDNLRELYLHKSMPAYTPKFISFSYEETIWPREVNTFLDKTRGRKNFINDFWRDSRTDRAKTNVTNSVDEIITSQSLWPLDARLNFESAGAPEATPSGEGSLLRTSVIFHSGGTAQAGPLYAYPNWDAHEKLASEIVYGSHTLWEAGVQSGKNPFYNTYSDYNNDIRRVGKDYSIIPEFRISEHIEYYLDEIDGNFFVNRDNILTLTGAAYASASGEDNFFSIYAHADFLRHFKVVTNLEKSFSKPSEIKLTCKALMKFLPYDGFYPAQRTIQLVQLFSQSYAHDVFKLTKDLYGNTISESNMRTFYQPLFSPGILYNTIKSGIAVDWPVHTNLIPTASFTGSTANNTEDDCGAGSLVLRFPRVGSDFNKRIPFEALVDPKSYMAGINIADSNPHPSASLGSMVRWGGSEHSPKYRLAMHNFLAESADFFLEGGEFTTFESAADTDQNFFSFEEEKPYMMDVLMYRTHDHSKYNLSTAYDAVHMIAGDDVPSKIEMYSNPGAFGPLVDQTFVYSGSAVTGAARNPYLPPYYNGTARARLSFTPYNGPGRYTIPEIVAHLTATYARVMGTAGTDEFSTRAKNASWSAPDATAVFTINLKQSQEFHHYGDTPKTGLLLNRTSSIDYRNAMQISSSLNLFQVTNELTFQIDAETGQATANVGGFDKGARWNIQPKWETLVLNFSSSAYTLSTPDSGSNSKGMWHQYGTQPIGRNGIFIEITEPTNHHLFGDPHIQTDVSIVRRETAVNTNETGSLAKKCGFIQAGSNVALKKIGVPRKDNETSLKEAIVLIPFVKTTNRRTSAVTTKFFNLNKNTVKRALKDIKRGITQSESEVSKSIYDTILAMTEYVIPPKFDFVTQIAREQKSKSNTTWLPVNKVKPFAMYFFEFEHKLTRKDLTDIWQNLPPDVGRYFKESETSISHKLLKNELMKELPETELHWIVFKVKKRAKQNYFEKTADTLDDALFKFDVGGKKDIIPEYSYNWPYDYCSLIELAKIDAEVKFEKTGGKEATTTTTTTTTTEGNTTTEEKTTTTQEEEDVEAQTTTGFGATTGPGDLLS